MPATASWMRRRKLKAAATASSSESRQGGKQLNYTKPCRPLHAEAGYRFVRLEDFVGRVKKTPCFEGGSREGGVRERGREGGRKTDSERCGRVGGGGLGVEEIERVTKRDREREREKWKDEDGGSRKHNLGGREG